MIDVKRKWAWLTAAILLPGVFRLLGEVFAEPLRAGVAGPIVAMGLCVAIAAAAIFMAVRAVT